jgi:hypothetical protein
LNTLICALRAQVNMTLNLLINFCLYFGIEGIQSTILCLKNANTSQKTKSSKVLVENNIVQISNILTTQIHIIN